MNMAMIEKGTTGQGITEMAFIKKQGQNIIQEVLTDTEDIKKPAQYIIRKVIMNMDMINMAMIEKGTTGQGIIEMAFIKRQEQNIIQKVLI